MGAAGAFEATTELQEVKTCFGSAVPGATLGTSGLVARFVTNLERPPGAWIEASSPVAEAMGEGAREVVPLTEVVGPLGVID